MRRTSRPRQQDHALPVLAPQRRGGRISVQQKAHPCAEQRQKSSTVSAVSGLRHTISTKTAPGTYEAGVFCRLRKQNFAATLRHCGEADFSALCPMDAQSVAISFGGMSNAVPYGIRRGDGGSPGLHTDSGTEFRHFAFRTGRIAGIAHVPPEPYQAVIHVAPCIPWK